MQERFRHIISEVEQELPFKELLKRRFHLSSRLLRKLKQADDLVRCNGRPVKLYEKGRAGDILTLDVPEETSGFDPEPIPIRVLYEDADILVIDKQPGLVVHPTKGHPAHTIANGLMYRMLERGERYKIRFVNRLDMDTSGVLLVGKHSHAQDDFARQAGEGRVAKEYIALVKGLPAPTEGTIDLPVGKPVDEQVRRAVIPEGDPSVTRYRTLETFGRAYALLALELLTGRTHQIRVHLSHIGHPVAGDHLYGGSDPFLIERQALHASRLSFDHPATGRRITVEAPLPDDIAAVLERLRKAGNKA